jgi:hypothetical protein
LDSKVETVYKFYEEESDVRQDLKIGNLEMQMNKVNEKLFNGGKK